MVMLLKRAEVILMQEDVLVYGFERVGLPFYHDDPGEARRLFTPSVGTAVLRFRCANEKAYCNNVRQHTIKRLLEPSAEMLGDFARTQVEEIFSNREENFMRFFRYLAFTLDLSVFCHRYRKIDLMNPVFVECERVFDSYLSDEEELPFWRNFFALCDVVLRNSSGVGRPIRHFRNPAVHWDPKDKTFDPDDPAFFWTLPEFLIRYDHPILQPDRYAKERVYAGTNKEDLSIESLNLGTTSSSNLGATSSNLGTNSSNIGGNGLGLSTDSLNLSADSLNSSVAKDGRSNIPTIREADSTVSDKENPNLEGGNPNPEAVNPNLEGGNPNPEAVNPNLEGGNPNPEAENPDLEDDNQNPDPYEVLIAAMQWNMPKWDENAPNLPLDPNPWDK